MNSEDRRNRWTTYSPTGLASPPEPVGVHDVDIRGVVLVKVEKTDFRHSYDYKGQQARIEELEAALMDCVRDADDVEGGFVGMKALRGTLFVGAYAIRSEWKGEYDYDSLNADGPIDAELNRLVDVDAMKSAGFTVVSVDTDFDIE